MRRRGVRRNTRIQRALLPFLAAATAAALLFVAGPASSECSTAGLPDGRLVAELQTSLGQVCIELLDGPDEAPGHVANFVRYLNDGRLVDTFFHRWVEDFVVQGASFRFEGDTWGTVESYPYVVHNEPCELDTLYDEGDPADPSDDVYICSERGNEAYTVALAKQGGDPDSGSASWFFSLADNRPNLDNQNGGFTVFGRVTDPASRAVIDAMGAQPDPFPTYEDLFWVGLDSRSLLGLAQQNDVPFFGTMPPYDGDGSTCLDMSRLATVLQPDLGDLLFEYGTPADEPPFYLTVPADCGTPFTGSILGWVPQPGSPSCPDLDRAALRTLAPTEETGDTPTVPSPFAYVTFTCEQLDEAISLRDAWRQDMRDTLLGGLVFIEQAEVRFAPEPSMGATMATAIAAFAWLRNRRRPSARN